jgi:hypothetical protein
MGVFCSAFGLENHAVIALIGGTQIKIILHIIPKNRLIELSILLASNNTYRWRLHLLYCCEPRSSH